VDKLDIDQASHFVHCIFCWSYLCRLELRVSPKDLQPLMSNACPATGERQAYITTTATAMYSHLLRRLCIQPARGSSKYSNYRSSTNEPLQMKLQLRVKGGAGRLLASFTATISGKLQVVLLFKLP
jgi:hypothetical protein